MTPDLTAIPPPENGPALWRALLPLRAPEDHKYRRGACFVWSGPELATGASRLAARAALRIGAGLVTIAGARAALNVHAAHVSAIMLREAETIAEWREAISDPRIRGIILGPAAGRTTRTRQAVRAALATEAHVVIDADALTAFAEAPERLFGLIRRRQAGTILTPHAGEFAALFPDLAEVARDAAAGAAAARAGAVLVLKGHETRIAGPDGRIVINRNAPPSLATAGSGDVLAGMIGGLATQGMPAFEAAAAGVWLHGEAGRIAGPRPIADDLVEALARLPDFAALGG